MFGAFQTAQTASMMYHALFWGRCLITLKVNPGSCYCFTLLMCLFPLTYSQPQLLKCTQNDLCNKSHMCNSCKHFLIYMSHAFSSGEQLDGLCWRTWGPVWGHMSHDTWQTGAADPSDSPGTNTEDCICLTSVALCLTLLHVYEKQMVFIEQV